MPTSPQILWYTSPARQWHDALPLGNGRLGALMFGDPVRERFVFNEETFWTGGPYDTSVKTPKGALEEVRRLIFAGEHKKAHYLFGNTMMGRPVTQMKYQPLGGLYLAFDGFDEVEEYQRDLDLPTAVATVSFKKDGVRYTRECFVSHPDQTICIRLSASEPGKLSFTADLFGGTGGEEAFEGDGWCERQTKGMNEIVVTGKNPSLCGNKGRLRFEMRGKVKAKGGAVEAQADGCIRVTDADEVTIIIGAATNFVAYNDVSADPAQRVRKQMSRALKCSYAEIKADHIADHQSLFGRVHVTLPSDANSKLPTDERLKKYRREIDPAFAALYYQFGRYLLIASSRPGGVPANLQGIWNPEKNPSWSSKWTTNINLEMNYWPAEVSNLPECVEPLTCMVEGLSKTGAKTAKNIYGAPGWVFHQNSDLWLAAAPMDGPSWGSFQVGGAWLCQHLWEHWLYTQDEDYLKRIYPTLKSSAEFFLNTLVEHPDKGWLVTSPSTSPENFPAYPGNGRYYDEQLRFWMPGTTICAGPTCDMQILRDLFRNCETAAETLGVDVKLREQWAGTRERLAPMQVGRAGNLQEWIEDVEDLEYEHRHISHLYGAFPSDQITPEETPDLVDAVKVSLHQKGDGGTGFGMSWKSAIWSRFNDGDHALTCFVNLMRANTCNNLFSVCFSTPQVDGTFGGTAAVAEMLLQSHGGIIRPLPALPREWSTGSFSGLMARGAVEVDATWSQGRIRSTTLRPEKTGIIRLMPPKGVQVSTMTAGNAVKFKALPNRVVEFRATAGKAIEIKYKKHAPSVPKRPVDPELFQTDFSVEELAQRRNRVYDAIGKSHAILQGAANLPTMDIFRQNNEFYYLSGIEVPHAYLLLDGAERKTTLFLPHRTGSDRGACFWAEDDALIRQMTGIDEVCAVEKLKRKIRLVEKLFVSHKEVEGHRQARDSIRSAHNKMLADEWDGLKPRHERFIDHLRERLPKAKLHDLAPILDDMRRVKSPREIELMRVAGALSAKAAIEAMKLSRPGLNEWHLHAAAQYVFRTGGARGEAYQAIIPSGRNIRHVHYMANHNPLEDGNLVLFDGAPDYRYYTSDIGRMFPVNGTYNQWQRMLYGFVVDYHKVLLSHIKPGLMADDVLQNAAEEMRPRLPDYHLNKSIYRKGAEKLLTQRGSLSHAVGMSVHDSGVYKDKPLEPGVVFAVDPEYRAPEENMYIRVEDTVVVTEAGIENLTGAAPLELDDVEALMKENSDLPIFEA